MKNQDLNLKALFLGDKGENVDVFKSLTNKLIDEHVGWRQNYMPQDMAVITTGDKHSDSFLKTQEKMETVLEELSCKLRTESLPWNSAGRFWGHMNSETLMPAMLAYSFAMMWNGNNVAYESSPATSKMEEEVGMDFAKLMGFENGWGHIAADGSIANLEGLWYARNLKSLPLAVKEIMPELVKGKSDWELLNMTTDEIVNLMVLAKENLDEIKDKTARGGMNLSKLGVWIVPATKHYSWLKAADIIGIGTNQVIECEVTNHYQMDIDVLEKIIKEHTAKQIPILGVVGVVGSTEEGQVDRIDKIAALRQKLIKEGIYFYLHVDAAYGGYARSIFLDENNKLIPYENIKEVYKAYNIFQGEDKWLTEEIYKSFEAISQAESVTIDPHKMGYIPYSAGGIAIREKSMREAISYFATYVFEKNAEIPALLGAYILEGSKAGATAAAVWTTHKILPPNISGYGKLIGASIEGAYNFYNFIKDKEFVINGKKVKMNTLTLPNFNMVDYIFTVEGEKDLSKTNDLNHLFYEYASYVKGSIYENEFITSHTDFATTDYGNSPFDFVNSMGFDWGQWDHSKKVTILRASCMSPYMADKETFDTFAPKIEAAIKKKLEQIIK